VANKEVVLVTPDRSITYPSAEYVKDAINTQSVKRLQSELVFVIDGRKIHNLDSTAVKVYCITF
jgi:MFS superfamily sulfate permease-like transporter